MLFCEANVVIAAGNELLPGHAIVEFAYTFDDTDADSVLGWIPLRITRLHNFRW